MMDAAGLIFLLWSLAMAIVGYFIGTARERGKG